MARPVKTNVPNNPLGVALLSAHGVVLHTHYLSDLVEKTWWLRQRELSGTLLQNLPVEKVEGCATCLQCRQRISFAPHDVLEEASDFCQAHLPGMAFVVEQNKPPTPVYEGVDCGVGVAASTSKVAP